jgi:hypothetical protein
MPAQESEHAGLVEADGCWQHSGAGQDDFIRTIVSRPRNQRESSYQTPNVTAKARSPTE